MFVLAVVFVVAFFGSVKIVPQSQNYLVERLGKYSRTLGAGFHLTSPLLDRVRHKIDVLERQLPPIMIPAITLDNVGIDISLAILYRVTDAAKSVYRVRDVDQAIQTMVIGTVRSVIGKSDLDEVQSNRRSLSEEIERELAAVCEEWGVVLSRVEIIDVDVDNETKAAMQLQLNAERTRRALVREAEGKKQAAQLAADAELYSAQKKAEANKLLSDAEAYSVTAVSRAIAEGGLPAVEFEIKKLQAEAIKSLTGSNNAKIVIIPTDVLDAVRGVSRVISRES